MQEENILIQAGLSEEQAQAYQSLLDKGPQRASDLAKWTGIKRGLIYKVLEQLESMGLVSKQGGPGTVAVFSPAHPSLLLANIERKEKEIALNKEMLLSSIGALSSKYNLIIGKPSIQFFEGTEGVKRVLYDSLNQDGEILTYIDSEILQKNPAALKINEEYVEKREKLKIKKRMLLRSTPIIEERAKKFNKEFTEVRFIPNQYPFEALTQVYGDKISYIVVSEKLLMGIIIENPSIALMQKTLFEYIWSTVKDSNSEDHVPQVV